MSRQKQVKGALRGIRWGIGLLGIGVLLVGCGASRPNYRSNKTAEFVAVDTVREAGASIAPVYRPYRLQGRWPQHFLPLEQPDPSKAGQVRQKVIIRTDWPLYEPGDVATDIYALTMCELASGASCRPEQAFIFFSIQTPLGRTGEKRFTMKMERNFRVYIDDREIDVPPLSYESHGVVGTVLEELWVALPFERFEQIAQAEHLRFRIGRYDLRLGGREMKPFRAILAAIQGNDQI